MVKFDHQLPLEPFSELTKTIAQHSLFELSLEQKTQCEKRGGSQQGRLRRSLQGRFLGPAARSLALRVFQATAGGGAVWGGLPRPILIEACRHSTNCGPCCLSTSKLSTRIAHCGCLTPSGRRNAGRVKVRQARGVRLVGRMGRTRRMLLSLATRCLEAMAFSGDGL